MVGLLYYCISDARSSKYQIKFHAEFHADGQTGMTKLVATFFCNFSNGPKTASSCIQLLQNANHAMCRLFILPRTHTGLYVGRVGLYLQLLRVCGDDVVQLCRASHA